MLDVLAVGPKFTRPACRAAAAAIDRYVRSAPDLSSKPADRRCCRSTEQTDGRTYGRTLDRFMTLTAYCADRVLMSTLLQWCIVSTLNHPHIENKTVK